MFYAKDGLSFERAADGTVGIYHQAINGGAGVKIANLDPDTWASVVASMSAAGETGETFQTASAFHMGA